MKIASFTHKCLSIILVLVLVFMTSCSSDDDTSEIAGPPAGEQAPPLPPLSSFVMDINGFSDTKQMSEIAATSSLVHLRAAVQVTVWQAVLLTTPVVPVTAFGEFTTEVGIALLHEGSNTLTIEAVVGNGYDDFEFVNVCMWLNRGSGRSNEMMVSQVSLLDWWLI